MKRIQILRFLVCLIACCLMLAGILMSCQQEKQEDLAEDFTIILLPDTQLYSEKHPEIFDIQTQWIVDNAESLNVAFVTHLGDIVQHANESEIEWERANNSMSKLDGVVPYGFTPGNHDLAEDGAGPLYNKYFGSTRYENEPWWGGNYLGNKNNYQLFSAGGMDFIIVHLESSAPDEVLEWANGILQKYSDRWAIISTHIYLHDDTETWTTEPYKRTYGNSGKHIWDKLVKMNGNVFMVVCGHWGGFGGEALQISTNAGGTVYEILADYQKRSNGGDGWLRILKFAPSESRIYVKTYSPHLDRYETDIDSQYTLTFPTANKGRLMSASR